MASDQANTEVTRTCNTCRLEKSLHQDFYRDSKGKHGRAYRCIACTKQRCRTFYLDNRERQIAKAREFRQADLERNREYQAAYRERYPEKMQAAREAWLAKHPEAPAEFAARRRARIRRAFVAPVDGFEIWLRDKGKCGICQSSIADEYHLDHIRPLSKGGTHEPQNVQLAHPACNQRKGATWPWTPTTVL